jgi:hypothetical protein
MSSKYSLSIFLSIFVCFVGIRQGLSQSPAQPVDPISTIINAFRSHSIVALGEGEHGSEQDQALRLSVIRDPRFATVVNDIVTEKGNSKYQDVMDQFTKGGAVSDRTLREVWENTTVTHTGADSPVYEEFFRAVRSVNDSLPQERRIRVLLGDPPIDWDQVHTFEDVLRWGDQRDFFAADLIRREVLAKGRRALVIYGKMHFERKNDVTNFETSDMLAGLLESEGAKLFTIWTFGRSDADLKTLKPDAVRWQKPTLVLLRGTDLGAFDFGAYFTSDRRFSMRTGRPTPLAKTEWRKMRMEDQFDAALYLGAPSEIKVVPLAPQRCADSEYMKMRLARMALQPGNEGAIERLKTYCSGALKTTPAQW